jgi:pyridoxine 5'-phosphate synthase PdxJ
MTELNIGHFLIGAAVFFRAARTRSLPCAALMDDAREKDIA